ncbi:neuralized-like protein 4 [Rhopilema esculentum]|uniref:neuralized-like protein 4 n=1 Tax=Rhopilema esculentum TaxID=499914 RepID=UPI0031DEBC95|eukprot:gene13679-4583_t
MVGQRWQMHFHRRCGRYIKLSDHNQRARREGDTYDHGLVFSERPLHTGELFQLKIEEMELKWAGSLRIGVTTENPNLNETKIARAVTDLFTSDDENYWVLSGQSVHNGKKEFEYNKLNMYSLRVYDRVAVQVKSNGDLHFYENGFDRGIAMRDMPIQKELFAVFDLYGQTKQVSWDYFGAPSLEKLCQKKLRLYLSKEEIDKIPLPASLKEFLQSALD